MKNSSVKILLGMIVVLLGVIVVINVMMYFRGPVAFPTVMSLPGNSEPTSAMIPVNSATCTALFGGNCPGNQIPASILTPASPEPGQTLVTISPAQVTANAKHPTPILPTDNPDDPIVSPIPR